ncbi:MAG: alpha/beta hydrolase [Beijerinckiaceae bacterium]
MQASHFTLSTPLGDRTIAYLRRNGLGPPVVWLGGFRSDMRATKAGALDDWAERSGRAFLRFDYSGHGESSGPFGDGTISSWLEDALEAITRHAGARPLLVGSSMGGWIALLAARALAARGEALTGLVLIAPAVDFTDALMWAQFPDAVKKTIEAEGQWLRHSEYSPDPYPITKKLIEDGRRHALLGAPITPGCPVHILQGMADPDVPWQHAMTLVEHLPGDATTLTLIKDGDHRLSRPQDLAVLTRSVEAMAQPG